MLAKKDPFDGRTPQETKFNILNHQFDRQMNLQKFCNEKITDPLLQNILMNCLALNENARPSCRQVAEMLENFQSEENSIDMGKKISKNGLNTSY